MRRSRFNRATKPENLVLKSPRNLGELVYALNGHPAVESSPYNRPISTAFQRIQEGKLTAIIMTF
jgi:hypothetical protein